MALAVFYHQGWKLLSCSQCQELGQRSSLASDWLHETKEPIRSQVISLTKLLTLTTTQKFPPQAISILALLILVIYLMVGTAALTPAPPLPASLTSWEVTTPFSRPSTLSGQTTPGPRPGSTPSSAGVLLVFTRRKTIKTRKIILFSPPHLNFPP